LQSSRPVALAWAQKNQAAFRPPDRFVLLV
jgi:hypothetical protein